MVHSRVVESIESHDKLTDLVETLYTQHNRVVVPRYPWVAVRVLAKEQISGLIITPEKQNKLVHEGVVLATWEPIHLQVDMVRIDVEDKKWPTYKPRVIGRGVECSICEGEGVVRHMNRSDNFEETAEACGTCGGSGYEFTAGLGRTHRSALKPGDHVLFPHWAGLPIAGFSSEHYRFVKEEGWKSNNDGGIFATVEYGPVAGRAEEVFMDIVKQVILAEGVDMTRDAAERLVSQVQERMLLVDREGRGVSLSGR